MTADLVHFFLLVSAFCSIKTEITLRTLLFYFFVVLLFQRFDRDPNHPLRNVQQNAPQKQRS